MGKNQLEASEQINLFVEFLEQNYKPELEGQLAKGRNFLDVDFNELSKFSPDLAEELLDSPEDVLKAGEIAVERFDHEGKTKNFALRFFDLPESQIIEIRNIRSRHLSKMIQAKGIVRQKSDVRPQVTSAKFECPSCGNMISVLQLDQKFKEPSSCGCGRKGRFRLLDKELVDAQKIVLEEASEDLEGAGQPKRLNVFLKKDLVSPMSEKKTNPGSKIEVTGVLNEVPITARDGGKLTRFDLMIEVNHITPIEEEFLEITISPEEEEEIKKLSKDPKIYSKFVNSIAPSIYGYDKVKLALVLQLMGGVKKTRDDGVTTRGDMHILLVGDPGAGKCVAGSSKIILENGEIITIKSFYEKNISFKENDSTMKVFSINEKGLSFKSEPIRFWRRKSPKQMLKITTQTGNEIVVTKEHPLFTTKNGLIFANRADDYKEGDHLALPSKINIEGSIQPVPLKITKTNANNKVRYTPKDIFDKDFSRLLGYLTGDGYVRFRKTTGFISFTNNNKGLLDDFERLIKSVFSLNVSKRKKKNNSSYEYYISSIDIVRILQNIEPNIIKKSGSMCIPNSVTKSPDYIVKEFLKSLFDCEGHIRKERREIEFSSKSKELIYDIKYLLLRFGIISQASSALKFAANTKSKTKREYYRLRISGKDVIAFHDKIGFISKEKNQQLERIINLEKKINTNLDIIPNIAGILKTLRAKHNLTQFDFPISRSTYQHYERGDRFPSYEKLIEISKKYDKLKSDDPLVKILNQISHADIFWDKIKLIEKIRCCDEFVYDLEIENVHNFIANGVMVHNSQLLKRMQIIAPKARYVAGKSASGAGLTATVVKDEFLGGWALEAGTLVLANKGMVMIDEMDKMSQEDTSAMHEALEQQTISISKANIQATLHAETTVLAAANPKFGRFDPYELIAKQIDLPSTLINRFDLIFPIKDLPNREKDANMANFILNLHQNVNLLKDKEEIRTTLLKKYVAYAKQTTKPKLTDEAMAEIQDYYVKMRNSGIDDESSIKAIPITARQLEALVRLSEASARVRLSDKITKEDSKRAIELVHHCLSQIGLDPETGKIDIDRISSGISASERGSISAVKEIINDLEASFGKTIPIEGILTEAESKKISKEKAEEVIEKLKRAGDIFEPKRGFIQKI